MAEEQPNLCPFALQPLPDDPYQVGIIWPGKSTCGHRFTLALLLENIYASNGITCAICNEFISDIAVFFISMVVRS